MAFLFDLDGTLIDSEEAHKSAEVETFRSLGYNFSEEDLFQFTGVPYKSMLRQVSPELNVETFFDAHRDRLTSLVGTTIMLFDDVAECLSSLQQPAVIVTSSPKWYVEAVLHAFPLLRETFASYVCADDINNGKPDPEPFVKGAKKLGFQPEECTAVEDSPNGVASAKAAGCFTVAVLRDTRLDLSEADTVVFSLSELANVA